MFSFVRNLVKSLNDSVQDIFFLIKFLKQNSHKNYSSQLIVEKALGQRHMNKIRNSNSFQLLENIHLHSIIKNFFGKIRPANDDENTFKNLENSPWFQFLAIPLFVVLMSSCAGMAPGGSTTQGEMGLGSEFSGNNFNGTSTSGAPSTKDESTGGGQVMPPSSIPAPMARKIIPYNTDSEGVTPIIGFKDAIVAEPSEIENMTVVVTTEALDLNKLETARTFFDKNNEMIAKRISERNSLWGKVKSKFNDVLVAIGVASNPIQMAYAVDAQLPKEFYFKGGDRPKPANGYTPPSSDKSAPQSDGSDKRPNPSNSGSAGSGSNFGPNINESDAEKVDEEIETYNEDGEEIEEVADAIDNKAEENAENTLAGFDSLKDSLCATAGVYCCENNKSGNIINAKEGSFECYQISSAKDFYVYTLHNKTGEIAPILNSASEQVALKKNENLLWLKEEIISADAAGTKTTVATDETQTRPTMFALTPSRGVKMVKVDNKLRVIGNHETNYESFRNQGAKEIAFDTTGGNVALLSEERGIDLVGVSVDEQTKMMETDSEAHQTVTTPDAERYTKVKTCTDGKTLFGIKPKPTTPRAALYDVNNPSVTFRYKDLNKTNSENNFDRTVQFDLDKSGNILAVYTEKIKNEDGELVDKFRVKIVSPGTGNPLIDKYTQKEKEISLDDMNQVNDFLISKTETDRGDTLLVDGKTGQIKNINYIAPNGTVEDFRINSSIDLKDKSAEKISINNNGTKAFVVNSNDGSITVVNLEGDLSREKDFKLEEIVNNDPFVKKDIDLKPSTIQFAGDQLVIGSKGLRGMIIVPLNNLSLY